MTTTKAEKLFDKALLLYLIHNANKKAVKIRLTHIQKLVFLSEWEMISHKKKGFNYDFIRLSYGPFSRELEKDTQSLITNTIFKLDENLQISEYGDTVYAIIESILDRYPSFLKIISEKIDNYGSWTAKQLQNYTHQLRHPYLPNHPTIHNLKLGTKILYNPKADKMQEVFELTNAEYDLLDLYLHKKKFTGLIESIQSVQKHECIRYEGE